MGHRTEEIIRVGGVDELIDRGIAADEVGDIDTAERVFDVASRRLGENHPRVLHLAGRIAWAHGDIERATGFFQQATDAEPDRAEIYIDCARCLQLMGEDSHAEQQVRAALELPGVDPMLQGDARLLLSRIRLDDDDPGEAFEHLEAIPEALKGQALYFSALADVLVELDRVDEALQCLARAVELEPDDPDYHYQRGLTQQARGDLDGGATSLARVLELEAKLRGNPSAPTMQEKQALQDELEAAMAELPDPLLSLVGSVPISVQAAATVEQVRAGADPRAAVFFVGQPKLEDQDATLNRIVVSRDVLVDEVEDEEEVGETLLVALVEEISDFFAREDLLFSEVGA